MRGETMKYVETILILSDAHWQADIGGGDRIESAGLDSGVTRVALETKKNAIRVLNKLGLMPKFVGEFSVEKPRQQVASCKVIEDAEGAWHYEIDYLDANGAPAKYIQEYSGIGPGARNKNFVRGWARDRHEQLLKSVAQCEIEEVPYKKEEATSTEVHSDGFELSRDENAGNIEILRAGLKWGCQILRGFGVCAVDRYPTFKTKEAAERVAKQECERLKLVPYFVSYTNINGKQVAY